MNRRPSSPILPKPTTYQGLGPNSTQKTRLVGEDYLTLYVMLLRHQFFYVGLNLTSPSSGDVRLTTTGSYPGLKVMMFITTSFEPMVIALVVT
jgi:hypothetical protein